MSDNNEPLLSLEETNALLDAMRSGTGDMAEVEGADLASPERPLRSALDRADASARAMAHAVDKLMIRLTGSSTNTEEQPAEILPYKVIRGSIAQASGVCSLRTTDGSTGMLILAPALVSFLLDRRMGAPLDASAGEGRMDLSPLDRRLLKPLMANLAEILGQHWCDDPGAFAAGDVYADAADMPMMAQFEPMLQIGLRLAAAGMASEPLTFALSVGAVRTSIPKKKVIAGPGITDLERAKMVDCIRDSNVRCTAVLGRTKSTLGHLLVLQAGDLLRLDGAPEQPVDVRVGDKVVLRGKPVLQHGNLAVQVSEVNGA